MFTQININSIIFRLLHLIRTDIIQSFQMLLSFGTHNEFQISIVLHHPYNLSGGD